MLKIRNYLELFIADRVTTMETTSQHSFDAESSAVQTHLRMMQDVIARMASNSASCKTWCVTLVAAVLVLVARFGDSLESNYALIALVPTIAFLVLDTYYLTLERGFRKSYDDFVCKLHKGKLKDKDLYKVEPKGNEVIQSLGSPSIWLFYVFLVVLILVVRFLVLN